MAPLLLTPPPDATLVPAQGTADLVILLTPIRGRDGQLRVQRTRVPAGHSIAQVLPPRQDWARVILNGGVVPLDRLTTTRLHPGDEVLAIPDWGIEPFSWTALAIAIGVSLAVSAITYGLTYLLFPPVKPHVAGPRDEPTFSFDGIQTTIGPGGMVPVVYGHHRIGGQLLSAAVDQVLTVTDDGVSEIALEAIAAPPTMSLLLALCEGPIDDILIHTIEINGQPLTNFPNVATSVRYGTPDQSAIPEFLESRNTFADGRVLSTEATLWTTTTAVEAFALNITFAEGLFTMSKTGDKQTNGAYVAYSYRPAGGAWSPERQYAITAARTAPVRFGIRREGLPLAVYDISVRWTGAWNQDETRSKWLPTLESVTEIQHNTNPFPNTALLAIRSLATDALHGAVPNVTIIVNGIKVRVNTFVDTRQASDNPAWCIMDLMTNTRYGMGIPDSSIDLGAFSTWASYCNQDIGEIRHTLNYVLDRELRAQPFLLEAMGGSRTLMVKSGGVWQPRPTRNETPTQLLTWANCTNVVVTYTRDPERVNVMEARFANEENAYQQDVLTWPTVEHWPAEVRKASLELRGVTKPSRVIRALQFELNRRKYENVTLSLDASLEAITFSVHDLFRFAHPLPGWSVSGRIQEGSTQAQILVDEAVTLDGSLLYHVYVRHADDTIELKPVINTGGTSTTLSLVFPLGQTPVPRMSTWVLGTYTQAQVEHTGRVFRATKVQRKSDTTVHIEAVIHNPTIFDEADAVALPVITTLFNPLGPSPPLTTLVLTEVTRVQASGASMRVVNLSWDVEALGGGYGPYGGAVIYRRTVEEGSAGGTAVAGSTAFGSLQALTDANRNFVLLAHLTGHILDFDDPTVLTGTTYLYRVLPISQRGVPNFNGGLERLIHVAGPTTPDYFPGTVRNLRLAGQALGVTTWDGPDVHLQWDPVADSPLFTETFLVQDYVIQVWAPEQRYLIRTTSLPAGPLNQTLTWSYTLQQNAEDQIAAGQLGAQRDLWIYVWARTNTNRQSLDPALLKVSNPPPDMSEILPDTTALFQAALINWNQWIEPRDFRMYTVYLDTQNPPQAIYQDVAIANRKLFPGNLLMDTQYWVQILPWDTFGPGVPSAIATFIPAALTADFLDTTPPALPTGLTLSTGNTISADGTTLAWVQASWKRSPEADIAGYELQFRIAPSLAATTFTVGPAETTARLESVPGGVTIFVKLLTFDKFHNVSPFTAEASILTSGDTLPPAAPTNLVAFGSIRSVALLWTPPADPDYTYAQVWAATVNNRASATLVGEGVFSFVHTSLTADDTRWYWVRSRDLSGNLSVAYFPASATAGIPGTAGQLNTTYISDLAATKITAGIITVLVNLGVNNIQLDGVQSAIRIFDGNNVQRTVLGKLGALSTDWGMQIFNSLGQLMWNFTDGAQTPGIANNAITATKISAAVITSTHLRTDTAVITVAAQIANALIGDAHITNLSASKIAAGTVQATLFIGASQRMTIDGLNDAIAVRDNNSFIDPLGMVRVLLGKIGGGVTDYGLQVYDAFGNLMWNLTSGATTLGIENLAVTNAKIANAAITNAKIENAAITNAKIGNLEVDSAKIANLTVGTGKIAANAVTESLMFTSGSAVTTVGEVEAARITFGTLNAGDQVWVTATVDGLKGAGAGTWTLHLREDSVGGADHQNVSVNPGRAGGAVQTVYTAGGGLSNKVFLLTVHSNDGDQISLLNVKLVGLRRQK